jgi:hypothetical protein
MRESLGIKTLADGDCSETSELWNVFQALPKSIGLSSITSSAAGQLLEHLSPAVPSVVDAWSFLARALVL